MTTPRRKSADATRPARPLGTGAWVVLPTYNEAENLRGIATAILDALPGATLLVVDDGSPDGTGAIADGMAGADARIRVRHRSAKQGLGRAYLDGFNVALNGGAQVVVQMDADWSHDPMTTSAPPSSACTKSTRYFVSCERSASISKKRS